MTPSPSSVAAVYGILLKVASTRRSSSTSAASFRDFVQRMPVANNDGPVQVAAREMLESHPEFHYTFTLKDTESFIQGVLERPKSTYTQDNVFSTVVAPRGGARVQDKLVNLQDKDKFKKELDLVSKQLTGAAPCQDW